MDRSSISNYREEFAQRAPYLAGADLPWLSQIRQNALDEFETTGFPTTSLEDWKYTNVTNLAKHAFKFAGASSPARVLESFIPVTEPRLVFINGTYSAVHSRQPHLPDGATVTHMANALTAGELEKYFQRQLKTANGFIALNRAWWSDGAYISLSRDLALNHVIHLVFIATEEDRACQVHNVIHLEPGASMSVIEHYLGENDITYFTNTVTQIEAERGASIAHYKVQEEGARAFHIGHIDVRQAEGSRLNSHVFASGALLSRTDIATGFMGEHCSTTMDGLYIANARQHMDHHTRIDHFAPRGTSREYYKGILDGAARGVFNGKVIVHADAQGSDASQSNRNLLLSDRAEVDTKPQLEIYADDVKCSHGATVAQLNEDEIFYLRSRGISDVAAKNVLTFAFAKEIIDRVRIDSLRENLQQSLRRKLPGERQ